MIVGGIFLTGFVLAALWMLPLIKKVQRDKELQKDRTGLIDPSAPREQKPVPARDAASLTNGMVWIPAGVFMRGSDGGRSLRRIVARQMEAVSVRTDTGNMRVNFGAAFPRMVLVFQYENSGTLSQDRARAAG